jgi:hypothetical protein
MLLSKRSLSVIVFSFIFTMGSFAQGEPQAPKVTDAEIEQFASAFQEIQELNQLLQAKMIDALEGAGMEVQRFNQLQQASQNPEADVEASEEEMAQFGEVSKEMQSMQMEAQSEMQSKIEEQGLDVNRYQQIAMQLQNDTELQQKFQSHLPQGQ